MNTRKKGRRLAILLVMAMMINLCLGNLGGMAIWAYPDRPATVNASTLNVRSGPGTTYPVAAKLSRGTGVTVIGEANATDGALWYQIRFQGVNGVVSTGYASNAYIKFPVAYDTDQGFEAALSAEGFPESYKIRLRQLHGEHPSWVFRAQKTNLDWNTAVWNESVVGRNLVQSSSLSSWKSIAEGAYNWETSTWPGFDGNSWVAASEDIIRFYMDPRNFLDDVGVFQFLRHTYDGNAQTADGLRTMVQGTFLAGDSPTGGASVGGNASPGGAGIPSGITPGGTGANPGFVDSGPGVMGPGGNPGGGGSPSGGSPGGGSPGSPPPGGNGGAPGNPEAGGSLEEAAPTPGSHSGVELEGPQASISRNETDILATGHGPGLVGPGATMPSPGGGAAPGGEAAPGGSYGAPSSGSSSYIDILMNAASQSGVNPYVLAAMIIQEQHPNGSGGSISGHEPGYEGYYNFFNIEAYQSGSLTPVQRGLWYASQPGSYGRPWNTVERSIIGGAVYYGTNYVKAGQDTFYLKKFNVQGSNIYKHQYMTNVQGAASEAAYYAQAYNDQMKKSQLEFKIPIYNNMPDNPSSKPLIDGSPNNKLSSLKVDGFGLTPTYNMDVQEYDLIVSPSVASVAVSAAPIDPKAVVGGTGNIQLQSGNNDIRVSVKAQNGSVRDYVIHVVRQTNGPTYTQGLGGQAASPGQGGTGQIGSPGQGQGPGANIGPGGFVGGGGSPASPGGSNVVITPAQGAPSSPGGGSSQGPMLSGPGNGGNLGPGVTQSGGAPGGTPQSGGAPGGTPQNGGAPGGTPQSSPAPTQGQSGGNPVMGDVNGDGKVDSRDLLKLQRQILGLEALPEKYRKAADMNHDGKINSLDLLLLKKQILGIR